MLLNEDLQHQREGHDIYQTSWAPSWILKSDIMAGHTDRAESVRYVLLYCVSSDSGQPGKKNLKAATEVYTSKKERLS